MCAYAWRLADVSCLAMLQISRLGNGVCVGQSVSITVSETVHGGTGV